MKKRKKMRRMMTTPMTLGVMRSHLRAQTVHLHLALPLHHQMMNRKKSEQADTSHVHLLTFAPKIYCTNVSFYQQLMHAKSILLLNCIFLIHKATFHSISLTTIYSYFTCKSYIYCRQSWCPSFLETYQLIHLGNTHSPKRDASWYM